MRRYSLILLGTTLLASAALAQQGPSGAGPRGGGAAAGDAAKARAMYEDIEIMRRLLIRSLSNRSIVFKLAQCTTCHTANEAYFEVAEGGESSGKFARRSTLYFNDSSRQAGAAFVDVDLDGYPDLFVANGAHPHGGIASFSLEGSYVSGYGVVFHMTLPAAAREDLTATPPPATTKSDSDWEQARRQLRGESGPTSLPARKATLVDSLLQVLADNGKNFSHLAPDEKLTIIVTFRGSASNPTALWLNNKGGSAASSPSLAAGGGGGPLPPPSGAGEGGGGGSPSAGSSGTPQPLTPDRELELLGDLHMKRGNLNDAVSAFERAVVQANADYVRSGNKAAQERVRELSRKLAETHLKMNNLDAARKALDIQPTTPPANADAKTATTKPSVAPPNLPAKLILSVSKRSLDLVGAGGMGREEFQKAVTIETPNFEKK